MLIWINGAFGAGKTTLSKLLVKEMPEAHIFDPEDMGYIIQKTFPPARSKDYQDLAMWRKLVVQFVNDSSQQFPSPLIIPMTLVVPAYLEEIFEGVMKSHTTLLHFFLLAEKEELDRRINDQVIIQNDPERDEEVRQWRLAQIDRCYSASSHMPQNTVFLDTNSNSPDELVKKIMITVQNLSL